jgi:hypothetical protein
MRDPGQGKGRIETKPPYDLFSRNPARPRQ